MARMKKRQPADGRTHAHLMGEHDICGKRHPIRVIRVIRGFLSWIEVHIPAAVSIAGFGGCTALS